MRYCMLKNLSDRSKDVLLKLTEWEEGVLTAQWKESEVVPICKPGKDPHLAGSYRPSNMSCRESYGRKD